MTNATNPTDPPKKRGCFFYGCITLLVLTLIAGVVGSFGVRYLVRSANKLAMEYTDTAPAPIEKVEVSSALLTELQQRVAAFKKGLEEQKSAQELVLSADDINALIWNDSAFKEVRGKLFVIIDGDRLKGKVSIPLDDLGPLKLKGRYLNGMASFKVSLDNGFLLVRLDEVEVKGKPLPAAVLTQLKNENLAKDAHNDPKSREAIEKFDSIQVKDGKIILKNKVK